MLRTSTMRGETDQRRRPHSRCELLPTKTKRSNDLGFESNGSRVTKILADTAAAYLGYDCPGGCNTGSQLFLTVKTGPCIESIRA
jgi:hypothetical protein